MQPTGPVPAGLLKGCVGNHYTGLQSESAQTKSGETLLYVCPVQCYASKAGVDKIQPSGQIEWPGMLYLACGAPPKDYYQPEAAPLKAGWRHGLSEVMRHQSEPALYLHLHGTLSTPTGSRTWRHRGALAQPEGTQLCLQYWEPHMLAWS